MPPSTAALTIGSAAVSSRTHGRSLSFPKLIMPRHTLDTLRPVRPRFVFLIATSSPSPTRRPYRRGVPLRIGGSLRVLTGGGRPGVPVDVAAKPFGQWCLGFLTDAQPYPFRLGLRQAWNANTGAQSGSGRGAAALASEAWRVRCAASSPR